MIHHVAVLAVLVRPVGRIFGLVLCIFGFVGVGIGGLISGGGSVLLSRTLPAFVALLFALTTRFDTVASDMIGQSTVVTRLGSVAGRRYGVSALIVVISVRSLVGTVVTVLIDSVSCHLRRGG